MAHKVLVLSPLHNMGASVVSMMIAQGATYDNKTSILVYTEPTSLLPLYIGVDDINDPTRSIMQIVKLIDNGAIADADIKDYAFTFAKNCYLLNIADKSLAEKDRIQVVRHVYSRVPTGLTVCDCSEDLNSKFTESLVEESDMIFIVIDSSQKAFQRLKLWLQEPILKNNSKDIYIVINEYNEVVMSVRNLAKKLGLPANRVCKLHYNPWITKCCLNGGLATILPLTQEYDARVVNLKSDIDELNQCIDGSIILKSKKGL